MHGSERRALKRFSIGLASRLRFTEHHGQEYEVKLMTRDVSAAGAYLNTSKPIPVGTPVNVDILLPIGNLMGNKEQFSHIDVSGIVIRTECDGMAISFKQNYRISSVIEEDNKKCTTGHGKK